MPVFESALRKQLFLWPSEPIPVELQQRRRAIKVIIRSAYSKRKEEIKLGKQEIVWRRREPSKDPTGAVIQAGACLLSDLQAAEQVAAYRRRAGEGVGRVTVTADSVIMCYSEKSSRGCRVDCLGGGARGDLAAFAAVASFGAAPVLNPILPFGGWPSPVSLSHGSRGAFGRTRAARLKELPLFQAA